MKLNLTRPIVFFDLETTGVNVMHDRIVELAYIKVMPDGTEEEESILINPGRPIPPESTAVHGITDEAVAFCPRFEEIADKVFAIFDGADIAGFNSSRFDVPLLMQEFSRAGVNFRTIDHKFVDVQTIYHKMEPRTLAAAHKFYCGSEFSDAHHALNDTRATYDVLMAQLDRYPHTDKFDNDIEKLARFSNQNNNVDLSGRFSYNADDEIVFNFGKHKGKAVKDVLTREPQYFSWMMQGDFPKDTKDVLVALYSEVQAARKK